MLKIWIFVAVVVAALVGVLWLNGSMIMKLEKKEKDAAIKASGGAAPPDLAGVLQQARALLARRDNDFARSGWASPEGAVAEIDTYIMAIAERTPIDRRKLEVLFAPTGPIQETSIDSGWAEEFLQLSAQFDYAVATYKLV